MFRQLCVAVMAICLSGCTVVNETYAPDGEKAYAIDCSDLGWADCYEAAGEKCGAAGYEILDRSSESTSSIGGSNSNFYGSTSNERSMLIACKIK